MSYEEKDGGGWGGISLPRLIRTTTAKVKSLVQMTLLQGAAIELLRGQLSKVTLTKCCLK